MTTILADLGNTNVKWAVFDGDSHGPVTIARVDRPAWIDAWPDDADSALICNVAGDALASKIGAALSERDIDATFVSPVADACGVTNGYRDPEQLGADRWIAMLAAWERCGEAVAVVDVGTAMTIDLIDDQGLHLGGFILPGPDLIQSSLTQRTSDIGSRASDDGGAPVPKCEPGKTTSAAVANGEAIACAGALDRAVGLLRDSARSEPRVLITGGAAQRITRSWAGEHEYVPGLVIEGLAILAAEAKRRG